MKTVLLIAFIGHVLCGICDCLLSYSPNGRLDLKGALKSPEKMREVFKDYPIRWSLLSIMFGVYISDFYSCTPYYMWFGRMVICETWKNR